MKEDDHLRVDVVELADFRSYQEFSLRPASGLTVIEGPNASGKTNLLEAIRLLTSGASFRSPRAEDLIRNGCSSARVSLHAKSDEGSVHEAVLIVDERGRRLSINGKQVRRRADATAKLPSVVFTPDDLLMIKGPAEGRRNAIDEIGEGLSSAYGALRRDYGRVLKHRNALLKEAGTTEEQLIPWTQQAASVGGRLVAHRVSLLARLAPEAEKVYAEISSGEELRIRYEGSYGMSLGWEKPPEAGEITALMEDALQKRGTEERRRGVTLAGPHRDDIAFRIAGADARTRSSQGQQRTAALAWKIAEVRVVQAITGRRPVLLLDDVMSELDAARRSALTAYVREGLQTFITATTLDYFDEELLAGAAIVSTRQETRR